MNIRKSLLLLLCLLSPPFTLAIEDFTALSGTFDEERQQTYCNDNPNGCSIVRDAMFPLDFTVQKAGKVMMLVYLQYVTHDNSNPAAPIAKNETFVSQFFPIVDQYSMLQIQNCRQQLFPFVNMAGDDLAKVQVHFYAAGALFKTVALTWVDYDDEHSYTVPFRTVVVQVEQGVIQRVSWAPTTCTLASCYCIAETCAVVNDDMKPLNVTVHVVWVGTDKRGGVMKSASFDIWKLQNAFAGKR